MSDQASKVQDTPGVVGLVTRYSVNGFYDNLQEHGPITGSGPGFEKAMAKFKARQEAKSKRGKWRANMNSWKAWKPEHGPYVDSSRFLIKTE